MWKTLCERAQTELSLSQFNVFDAVSFEAGTATSATAGAGAGKTRTLSFLVAKALVDKTVDDVYILTSTRTAKNEAIARVVGLLESTGLMRAGVRPIDPRNVRTIHSVALEHARRDAESVFDLAGVEVVSKTRVVEMIREFLVETYPLIPSTEDDLLSPEHMPADEAAEFLYNVRIERLNACEPVINDSLGFVAQRVLTRLHEHMDRSDAGTWLVDFAALIEKLRRDDVPLCYPGAVLFIDEAQDLTRCQLAIVLNTLLKRACVVMLGDDSQNIFRFSGACDRTISTFEEQCVRSDVQLTRHHLFTNFRSTNRIVDVSEKLLPLVDRRHRVGVTGNGEYGDPVEVLMSGENDDDLIASRILGVLSEGYAPGDVVVLRHKNWTNGDPIVQALRAQASQAGVVVPIAVGGASDSETLHGRFLAAMQATQDGDVDEEGVVAFLKALKCTRGCPLLSIRAVSSVMREFPVHDTLGVFAKRKQELLTTFAQLESAQGAKAAGAPKRTKLANSQKLRNFELLVNVAARAVRGVRELVRAVERDHPMARVRLDNGLAAFKLPGARPDAELGPLGRLVQTVLRDVVHSPSRATDAADVGELLSIFDLRLDVADTVEETIGKPLAQLHARVYDKEVNGKVVFSTIHKYKGLERPVAFVVQLREPWAATSWPQRAALFAQHDVGCNNRSGKLDTCCGRFGVAVERVEDAIKAEKRRLYYVAASRAKKRLLLHTAGCKPGEPLAAVAQLARGKTDEWVKVG